MVANRGGVSLRPLVDRSTFRSLKRSPGFTAMAVLSLGLAVGLTTTTFGVVDAVRHPYVAYPEPERFYGIYPAGEGPTGRTFSREMYLAVRNQAHFYESIASVGGNSGVPVVARGELARCLVEVVSTNYFDVARIHPTVGRGFRREDRDAPAEAGIIVSYEFWRRSMASALPLSRVPITVDDRTYTVVGVLPAKLEGSMVFMAMSRGAEEFADSGFGSAQVRLRPGVTDDQVQSELQALAATFIEKYGRGDHPFRYYAWAATTRGRLPRLTSFHTALSAAALIVLLIACANIANLLVARVFTRRRDIAVRMALGASQTDVAGYVLGEAILLASAGCAAGCLLSYWGMRLVQARLTERISSIGWVTPHLSWRVSVFAIVVSAVIVLLIAGGAIARARSTPVSEAMKDGAGTTTHRTRGVYRWLVVGEVALSLVVLLGAGLLIRATDVIRRFDFGFDVNNVYQVGSLEAPIAVPRNRAGPDTTEALYSRLAAGVRGLPGIRSVALATTGGAPIGAHVTADAGGTSPRELGLRSYLVVSPEFLSVLGVPIVDGRNFESGDVDSVGVAILDDSAAARLWPRESAVGHLMKLGKYDSKAPWVRVVGVARSVHLGFATDPDLPDEPAVYVARRFGRGITPSLVVRAGEDNREARVTMARYLRMAAPSRAIPYIYAWRTSFDNEVGMREFLAGVFILIAAFALGLATVGLYSLMAYTGAQRTREFAMRVALGARPVDLLRIVFRDALILVLAGTGVGAIVAMWSAQILKTWLYSIDPMDAVALVSAEAVLIFVCLLASLGPALRATRANPVELLRAT